MNVRRSSELSKYRLRSILAPSGIIAYVYIALTAAPAGSLELFPFFNWSLFSNATNPRSDVVMIVKSIDGHQLAKPTQFYDLGDKFAAAQSRDTRLAKTLDRLSYAVESGDSAMEERIKKSVDTYWLGNAMSVQYEIARIQYDPIERYREGHVRSSSTIATYEK